MNDIMVKCVNAHDKCYEGGNCPYCEPVFPLRHLNGKFASPNRIFLKQVSEKYSEELTRLSNR